MLIKYNTELWKRGGKQMSLEFSLQRSVADRGKPCHIWCSQCRGRWWAV